jgi:hypothetical protein
MTPGANAQLFSRRPIWPPDSDPLKLVNTNTNSPVLNYWPCTNTTRTAEKLALEVSRVKDWKELRGLRGGSCENLHS